MDAADDNEKSPAAPRWLTPLVLALVAILVTALAYSGVSVDDLLPQFLR